MLWDAQSHLLEGTTICKMREAAKEGRGIGEACVNASFSHLGTKLQNLVLP